MKSLGILEDNRILRDTIEDYIAISNKYHLIFSEDSYSSFSKTEYEVAPDYIILDIHLNDISGLDVIPDIKRIFPESHVIVITGDKDKDLILKAIQNGACGYLYKPFKMEELEKVISNVETSGSFLEPELLTKLMSLISIKNSQDLFGGKNEITPRENEIIELIKKGHTYKEMAELLHVSFHTINYHLKNIYIKANVRSKNELVAKYFFKK